MKLEVFPLLTVALCCLNLASGVVHSHHYMYTATTGMGSFPEFVIVGTVDGQQINYYDSDIKEMIPRQEWVRGAVDADFWKRNGQIALGTQASFAVDLVTVKERFNQTGGIHTIQYMYGCEWNDKTKQTNGFRQFGFDGEDFMVYDMETFRWIAPVQQAEISQRKFNSDQAQLEYEKNYITGQCVEWLQKYVTYGETTFQRQVPPEVSLSKKDHSSEVACHATGFYPEGVMINWKKDDMEMQEDVSVGETLPNEDGTFQKRAVLTVSPEERKKSQYTCEVVHTSGKPIVKILTESEGNSLGIIIGGVVAALVVIGAAVGFFMMRKKGASKVEKDYKKAEQSDTDSENSNPIARKGAECGDC